MRGVKFGALASFGFSVGTRGLGNVCTAGGQNLQYLCAVGKN